MFVRRLCYEILFVLLGMFFVIPCTDDYIPVDLRTRPFDVTPQEVWKSAVRSDNVLVLLVLSGLLVFLVLLVLLVLVVFLVLFWCSWCCWGFWCSWCC